MSSLRVIVGRGHGRMPPGEYDIVAPEMKWRCRTEADVAATIRPLRAAGRRILIRNLDWDLHPTDQKQIITDLRDVLRDVDADITVTTNSPYMVDAFHHDEVFIAREGRMACMTQHPDFHKWRWVMGPGEMWTFLGESWVLEFDDASQYRIRLLPMSNACGSGKRSGTSAEPGG